MSIDVEAIEARVRARLAAQAANESALFDAETETDSHGLTAQDRAYIAAGERRQQFAQSLIRQGLDPRNHMDEEPRRPIGGTGTW